MRVTIIRDDNVVIIDGRALTVDLFDMPLIHAVQWSGESGHVEQAGQPNARITSLAAYQTWISRWNDAAAAIDSYVPPVESLVPVSVSRLQARAALAQAGLFFAVDAYMSGLPADNIQRLAWQDATEFLRGSATVAAMATMLGLTESQVDQLFITAKGIEA